MTKELEFSAVYNLLNAIKEGDESKKESLNAMLKEFKEGESVESFLQELGQTYISIGLEELFKFADSNDLKLIGQLTKEDWDNLATKNNCDLPVHLANKMINHVKDNNMIENLSIKWKKSEREIEKHIMPMAAYITEGFIDVLE